MRKLLVILCLCLFTLVSVQAQTPVVPNDKDGAGLRPVPDPTVLTTEQIRREILSLRELQEGRLHGFEKAMDGMQKSLDARQGQIDKTVDGLQELHTEKFAGVQKQFDERDVRTDKTAELNQKAIDAAFQAAKQGVEEQNKSNAAANEKSERGFTKQIDGLGALITASNKALDDKITDLKDRLSLIEGRSTGRGDIWGWIAGAVGVVVGVGGLVVMVIMLTRPNGNGNGNGSESVHHYHQPRSRRSA